MVYFKWADPLQTGFYSIKINNCSIAISLFIILTVELPSKNCGHYSVQIFFKILGEM